MNISFSESNYVAFGQVSMNFEWTISNRAKQSVLESSIDSEYVLGENYFAELTGVYSTIEGCPISQFTFCDDTKILGVSSSMETTLPEFENLVLQEAFGLDKTSTEFQQYNAGRGLRDFAYSAGNIFVYPMSGIPLNNEIKVLLQKMLIESSPTEGLQVLEELLKRVEKIIIVSATYERCYILSKDMNSSSKWLSEICSQCNVRFINSSIDSFPEAIPDNHA